MAEAPDEGTTEGGDAERSEGFRRVDEPEKVPREELKFNKVAKQVDIKALKRDVWDQLREAGAAEGSGAAERVTSEVSFQRVITRLDEQVRRAAARPPHPHHPASVSRPCVPRAHGDWACPSYCPQPIPAAVAAARGAAQGGLVRVLLHLPAPPRQREGARAPHERRHGRYHSHSRVSSLARAPPARLFHTHSASMELLSGGGKAPQPAESGARWRTRCACTVQTHSLGRAAGAPNADAALLWHVSLGYNFQVRCDRAVQSDFKRDLRVISSGRAPES
eukprot:2769599-Prymnesium_polylepis.1